MNVLWRMIIRDMEWCFSLSLCTVTLRLIQLWSGKQSYSAFKRVQLVWTLQERDKTTELIKRGRNIEPPFFKTREKSHFSQWRFAPAWCIYRKLDFQQTTATTETPTFGLMLSGTHLNLQSVEETHREKDTKENDWINDKYVKDNFDCSLIIDTSVLENILEQSSRYLIRFVWHVYMCPTVSLWVFVNK